MPVPSYPSAPEARHDDGFLHGKDSLRLYWRRYAPPAPRATVAVLPGGGDHSGRYPGLTAELVRAGFEVVLLDFRGHGQSDGRRWHIDAFQDYLDDASAFMVHVRAGAAGRPVFVLGHSQGGLVAAAWGLVPGRGVAGFVLSSPWFRLKLEPPKVKVLAARALARVVPWVPLSTELKYADLTSDPEHQRWTETDPLYGKHATPGWFVAAERAQREVLRDAHRFGYPLLVLRGTADSIADPDAAKAFYDRATSADRELRSYEGFRHEIFNERERERPIRDTVAWLLARAPAVAVGR